MGALPIANIGRKDAILVYLLISLDSALEHYSGYSYILLFDSKQNECSTLLRCTKLNWCDVLEQDRTVESITPYGIGMLSLRNGLLQKNAFLRHNRCIELGKRYIKALASARVKQLSPDKS